MAWVREANESKEIIMAADSCLSGGQLFLAAPKLFPTSRGDCAFACAGATEYSFSVVEHILRAFELNKKLRDRATDITDTIHVIEDIANKCLHEEKDPVYASISGEGPGFSMIIAGFSWKKQKPLLKILSFNRHELKMKAYSPTTIKGHDIAVIGDEVGYCRGKIFHAIEESETGSTLDMQPLDVLMEFISDKKYPSINGYPQLLKIYPFLNILPFGFLHKTNERQQNDDTILRGSDEKGNKCFISYFGRPLLKYETFPYPIIDLSTGEIRYMYQRTGDIDFTLIHENPKPLLGFK